jgi:hypothetical protein
MAWPNEFEILVLGIYMIFGFDLRMWVVVGYRRFLFLKVFGLTYILDSYSMISVVSFLLLFHYF